MKFCLLFLFFFAMSVCYCQDNTLPLKIDSLVKDKNRFGKKIWVKELHPREGYQYHKKTKELIGIVLIYPPLKEMFFYVLDNKLVRVDVRVVDEKRKSHYSYYYFQNNTVVYKKEAGLVINDISELLLLFEQYKKKAEKLKEEKQI